MDYIPSRYDQVDLSAQKKTTKGNKAVEIGGAIIDLPATVGAGMLIGAWKIWQAKVPRPVKILLVAVLFPAGLFLLLLDLVAG
ncbi:hypothetical protein [Herbidospora mongoliensis]|uniref:hypothetical protein n=1 Tax=Herbidospora mongoliensis TaxID=688067 RepID=UPI00082D115C|nr:hypothetical protein [Herbidospora mongoliensis]